ncbi:MAG TPA: hypothetical protein VFJ19_14665 [Nocardioidaceae bacterium]|nr:hypothetical protein [Nocardioidaceae bacterium]
MTEEQEPVGSVGEEAARLLRALQGSAHEWAGHVAADGPECRYCPLCQLIGAVRETRPEMRHRLATAGSSLLQVAADILAAAASEGTQRRDEPVQKIDLDADWEEER